MNEVGHKCEEFCIFDGQDTVLEAESCADDPFYFWLLSEQVVDQVQQAQQDPEVLQVRTVEMWEEEKEWIVLDSGADVSLLPRRCAAGYDIPSPQVQLEDAQGNPLDISWMRQVEVEFGHCLNDDIGCCLNEAFIVSDVTNILLSFGRLLRRGWTFSGVCEEDRRLLEEASRGQCAGILGSPDGAVRIPVYFRKNSLSVFAHVRKVKEKETEQSLVRAVYVRVQVDIDSLKLGWQFLSNGNPVHKQHGKSFVDPSEALSTRV